MRRSSKSKEQSELHLLNLVENYLVMSYNETQHARLIPCDIATLVFFFWSFRLVLGLATIRFTFKTRVNIAPGMVSRIHKDGSIPKDLSEWTLTTSFTVVACMKPIHIIYCSSDVMPKLSDSFKIKEIIVQETISHL